MRESFERIVESSMPHAFLDIFDATVKIDIPKKDDSH